MAEPPNSETLPPEGWPRQGLTHNCLHSSAFEKRVTGHKRITSSFLNQLTTLTRSLLRAQGPWPQTGGSEIGGGGSECDPEPCKALA